MNLSNAMNVQSMSTLVANLVITLLGEGQHPNINVRQIFPYYKSKVISKLNTTYL
jgi:hypothetical protein